MYECINWNFGHTSRDWKMRHQKIQVCRIQVSRYFELASSTGILQLATFYVGTFMSGKPTRGEEVGVRGSWEQWLAQGSIGRIVDDLFSPKTLWKI